jgi:putative ABC transport system permease protein
MYNTEQKLGQMLVYFSGLAIFIACMGVFGLASHTAERRTKEIGIRKVLGASIPGVMMLFSREFTKWILIANLIAWPVAYLGMKRWLQNFAYRTEMEAWVFIASALTAVLIALFSTSYQSIKAAKGNPVVALRCE